jgi:hypothetical protein
MIPFKEPQARAFVRLIIIGRAELWLGVGKGLAPFRETVKTSASEPYTSADPLTLFVFDSSAPWPSKKWARCFHLPMLHFASSPRLVKTARCEAVFWNRQPAAAQEPQPPTSVAPSESHSRLVLTKATAFPRSIYTPAQIQTCKVTLRSTILVGGTTGLEASGDCRHL